MSKLAKIVAILTAKAGSEQALESLLCGMVAPCRAEPGNLRWDIWKDPTASGRFVLDELYKDIQALDEHRESEHFQHYRSVVASLAERQAYVVSPLDVADDSA